VNEEKRSIVEKELAAEPLSARTEFQFVGSNALEVEREAHEFFRVASGYPGRHFFGQGSARIKPPLFSAVPDEYEGYRPSGE
jgi:hypothetical protein